MSKARWSVLTIGIVLLLSSCGPAGYARIDPGGAYVYSNPVWSPDSKQIAYTRCALYDKTKGEKASTCELFVMDAATRAVRQLTDNAVYDGQPTWSPTGTQIAYRREEVAAGEPNRVTTSLRVIDGDGTHEREVYPCPVACNTPAWSPVEDRLAFQMAVSPAVEAASAVFTVRLNGSDLQQLTDGAAAVWKPRWSPDGRQIVFRQASDPALWLIDVDRRQMTALTVKEARGPDEPIFSPDGTGVAFSAYDNAKGKRLFWLNFTEGVVKPLLQADADYPPDMQEPDWSPDGKAIVFSAFYEKLYLADVEQTHIR